MIPVAYTDSMFLSKKMKIIMMNCRKYCTKLIDILRLEICNRSTRAISLSLSLKYNALSIELSLSAPFKLLSEMAKLILDVYGNFN